VNPKILALKLTVEVEIEMGHYPLRIAVTQFHLS